MHLSCSLKLNPVYLHCTTSIIFWMKKYDSNNFIFITFVFCTRLVIRYMFKLRWCNMLHMFNNTYLHLFMDNTIQRITTDCMHFIRLTALQCRFTWFIRLSSWCDIMCIIIVEPRSMCEIKYCDRSVLVKLSLQANSVRKSCVIKIKI